MQQLEILQRQFEEGANRFPGLMHIRLTYSPDVPKPAGFPAGEVLPRFGSEVPDCFKYGSHVVSGCLSHFYLIKQHHRDWDCHSGLTKFNGLARRAAETVERLTRFLPEILTKDEGQDNLSEYWLSVVHQLNVIKPLEKTESRFVMPKGPHPPNVYFLQLNKLIQPSKGDIFYLDDVFLESTLACSALNEQLSGTKAETNFSGFMSVADIAEAYKVDAEALRKRLDRLREKQPLDVDLFVERQDRGMREAKYLYNVKRVAPQIKELKRKQSSTERPAKKK